MHERSTLADPPRPAEPRQRWRSVLARLPDGPEQNQREVAETWERCLVAAGLPLVWSEGTPPRARISFGAPLPVGMAAEGELMDVVLGDRWPAWRVREALIAHLPPGWRLVDLFDVWLAGPALAGQVAAADYRIDLVVSRAPLSSNDANADAASLQRACAELLARPQLLRERPKGGGTVTYDLRPLLIDVSVREPGPPPVIVTRTRFHPELGMGRPEEVVAALGSATGVALEVGSITRQQLILSEDLARTS